MLVTRLGLRSIDVKHLELDDFDWSGIFQILLCDFLFEFQ
jgi:hypothetical protein